MPPAGAWPFASRSPLYQPSTMWYIVPRLSLRLPAPAAACDGDVSERQGVARAAQALLYPTAGATGFRKERHKACNDAERQGCGNSR